jgi:hypothetical protein
MSNTEKRSHKGTSLTKEAMLSVVAKSVSELRDDAADFTKLVELIDQICRQDVNLNTIETCKRVSCQLAKSKSRIDDIRKVMLVRAKTKMRELERAT